MPTSNNFPNNPNELENTRNTADRGNSSTLNIPPFVAPREGDVPMFDGGSRTSTASRSRDYTLRRIIQVPRARGDTQSLIGVNRKYRIRLRMCRRVLSLSNEARRTVLSAVSEALQIDASGTSTTPEDDQLTYTVELHEPFRNRRARARAASYDTNRGFGNDSSNSTLNRSVNSAREFNIRVARNSENELAQSGFSLTSILQRTAGSGMNFISSLFNPNQLPDNAGDRP